MDGIKERINKGAQMKKKYNIEKIKKEGYTKLNSLNDLKNLFTALNATIETGEGFTSYTIEAGPGKWTHTDLSKLKIKEGN
jgi:hypothetical protein